VPHDEVKERARPAAVVLVALGVTIGAIAVGGMFLLMEPAQPPRVEPILIDARPAERESNRDGRTEPRERSERRERPERPRRAAPRREAERAPAPAPAPPPAPLQPVTPPADDDDGGDDG
jgi:hypothetical protein